MILLNFSHPLTPAQLTHVETLTGQQVERAIDAPAQFDPAHLSGPQAVALVESCGLTPAEWQTAAILVVPPALNFIAVALLAELHGRMGYFAPCLRMRPVEGALPPRYEVAEILDLQGQRDVARRQR